MKRLLLGFAAALLLLCAALWAVLTQPFVWPQEPDTDLTAPSPARLRAIVRTLSVDCWPRSFDQPRRLAAAERFVHQALTEAGASVQVQELQVQGERHANLVARFGPADGPLTVVGAHYDSHGDPALAEQQGSRFSPDTHTPGADDNASGVAGLIELARLLTRHPPPRPVELVAYTLEEPPFFRSSDMGSARHAQALRQRGQPVELMIALEMIGYFSDAPGSQHYPFPGLALSYPSRGNFIGIVSRPQDWRATRRLKAAMTGASSLPVQSINAPPLLPGIDFSDHLSYWHEDMPAVMVTDTAFQRNTAYHQAGDTYERLDYARMAQVVHGVHAYLMRRR